MLHKKEITVKPDAKGRISLGSFAKDVSRFRIKEDKQHRLILEPLVEMSLSEKQRLEQNRVINKLAENKTGIKLGLLKGKIKMSDDFDILPPELLRAFNGEDD